MTIMPSTHAGSALGTAAARETVAVDAAELRRALGGIVARCQLVMAHAWMVRTFVKHSTEAEDFPDLMEMVRAVFDTSRALETRVDDPSGYVNMLRKKLSKLRSAADQFRTDAPAASTHTNFQQAVISIDTCVADLTDLLARGLDLVQRIRLAEQPAPAAGAAGASPVAGSTAAKLLLARQAAAASAASPTAARPAATAAEADSGADDDSDGARDDGGGPA